MSQCSSVAGSRFPSSDHGIAPHDSLLQSITTEKIPPQRILHYWYPSSDHSIAPHDSLLQRITTENTLPQVSGSRRAARLALERQRILLVELVYVCHTHTQTQTHTLSHTHTHTYIQARTEAACNSQGETEP